MISARGRRRPRPGDATASRTSRRAAPASTPSASGHAAATAARRRADSARDHPPLPRGRGATGRRHAPPTSLGNTRHRAQAGGDPVRAALRDPRRAGPVARAGGGADAYYGPGATPVGVSLERREQADDAIDLRRRLRRRALRRLRDARANLFADDDARPGRARSPTAGGIFRRDLQTGALELVARRATLVDEADEPGAASAAPRTRRSAATAASSRSRPASALVAARRRHDDIDVYVRDMDVAADAAGAYDLVSARDGGDAPATYAPRPPDQDFPGSNPGTDVTRGAAISDDGRRVVFQTRPSPATCRRRRCRTRRRSRSGARPRRRTRPGS